MVRGSRVLLCSVVSNGGGGGGGGSSSIRKALSEFLVCPLSKQPLRYCEESKSLISDEIGVSFPIINGIPCLVPKDGKVIQDEDKPNDG